jgi:hypothetical protein
VTSFCGFVLNPPEGSRLARTNRRLAAVLNAQSLPQVEWLSQRSYCHLPKSDGSMECPQNLRPTSAPPKLDEFWGWAQPI